MTRSVRMRLFRLGIVMAVATAGYADTITLKNGSTVKGTYLGGTARQVRVDTGTELRTLDVTDISRIEFESAAEPVIASRPVEPARPAEPARAVEPARPAEPARAAADEDRPTLRRGRVLRPETAPPPPPPPPARTGAVELPAGTNIVVRMIEGVDSDLNRVGQTFAAALDEPVMVDGLPAIPRGADVVVKLVDAKESGKLTGRSALTLALISVKVDGRVVDLNTQSVSRESESRGARTAKTAAGVGAVGAIIGAIAGGGKGAAIGAAAGGAAGAGAGIVLDGERVKIPSETRLTFVLDTPVKV